MGSAMPHATIENLKHLFHVLEEVLSDLTNREPPSTPACQHHSQTGPDMVQLKQLLVKLIHDGYPSVETIEATKPAQSGLASNEQEENAQVAEAIESPIGITLDDFKSFEKWASQESIPQFKKIVETYELPATFCSFWRNTLTLV